jgi:hypothetical protein
MITVIDEFTRTQCTLGELFDSIPPWDPDELTLYYKGLHFPSNPFHSPIQQLYTYPTSNPEVFVAFGW